MSSSKHVPFNQVFLTGKELDYVQDAVSRKHISGNGYYSKECQKLLKERMGSQKVLLTHSATAALEMSALLADIQPGDEVILPSFTFVSTALAFVMRGAVPVFVDIRPDTFNIDENLITAAISKKTKAIVPVHYSGVGAEMTEILKIAKENQLFVIEDSAPSIEASYQGRPLGSMGNFGIFSFHETKNVQCGEGGALIINDPQFSERAEILWEKGTNRSLFFQGKVDRYTWVDLGSSYLASDLSAAFLYAQLEKSQDITQRRRRAWNQYHQFFESFEEQGILTRPVVPKGCIHNAQSYYILLKDSESRDQFLSKLREMGLDVCFHYIPLHSSPAGKKFCKSGSALSVTDDVSQRIVRLPLWVGIEEHFDYIFDCLNRYFKS